MVCHQLKGMIVYLFTIFDIKIMNSIEYFQKYHIEEYYIVMQKVHLLPNNNFLRILHSWSVSYFGSLELILSQRKLTPH